MNQQLASVGVNACKTIGRDKRQRGLGIIEVLVALVVVSFGVLGMAGLQLSGMKQSTSAFNRTKALTLTENLATRMRINREAARSQLYNNFDSSAIDCASKPDPYCQAHPGGNAQSCDIAELAAFDLYSVACGDFGNDSANAGIAGLLPAGSVMQVSCDDASCVANSSYTISASWPEGRNSSSDDDFETRQVQMRLRP